MCALACLLVSLACLLAGCIACSLVCLLVCLLARLLACLLVCFLACLLLVCPMQLKYVFAAKSKSEGQNEIGIKSASGAELKRSVLKHFNALHPTLSKSKNTFSVCVIIGSRWFSGGRGGIVFEGTRPGGPDTSPCHRRQT